jgi:multidrug efflux pump subunit AcrA (membrane-fusion protein)
MTGAEHPTTEETVGTEHGADEAPDAAARVRPSRRRTPWFIAGACLAVIGLAAATFALTRPEASASDGDHDGGTADLATATIARGDLTERVRLSGKLGYGDARDLGTGIGGIVTWVPEPGSALDRGSTLFRVDDQPVVLFLGELPMWRAFTPGMDDGPDVLQLEQNLAALGFFDREPDQEFAASTASAIEDWQESLGLEETGAIEPGRIVFAPGPLRVAARKASIGDPGGSAIITASGTEKRVSAFLAPNLKEIAVVGTVVQLTLPGGRSTTGTVTAVGAPVEQDDGQGGTKLKLPVTITLDDAASADGLDQVSVSGEITAVKREDALVVPVVALLALPGGGSAVEVVRGGAVEQVAIELGAFADGMVEVTGGDLEAGDEVVVPE